MFGGKVHNLMIQLWEIRKREESVMTPRSWLEYPDASLVVASTERRTEKE